MRTLIFLIAAASLILPAVTPRALGGQPPIGWSAGETSQHQERDANGRLTAMIHEHENGVRVVEVCGPDGKPVSQHTELPEDPAKRAALDAQEQSLIAAIASAPDDGKDGKRVDLINFYLFTIHNNPRAAAMAAQLDPGVFQVVTLQVINFSPDLSTAEKIKAYKDLLARFPDERNTIEDLMKDAAATSYHRWPVLKL